MNDDHPLPAIAADALFVIACPTCLGQLSAMAGLASRRACCPLCAATFVIPEPRISSRSAPPAEPSARHQAPLPTRAVPSGTSESPAEPAMPSVAVEAATDNAAPTDVALVFQEPVRTIGSGAAAVELRRLSDEERRLRRSRRSLILLLVGAAVLVAIVVILGMPARPR